MRRVYSRLARTEERTHRKKAYLYVFLTLILGTGIFFVGMPAVFKFAAFLSEFRKTGEPVDKQDTTPPAPPHLEPLPEATNKGRLEIRGTTEPGITVILFLNDETKEVLSNSEGGFYFEYSLRKGENRMSVSSKDGSGNESHKTSEQRIVYDNEAPTLNITSPEDGTNFYGSRQRQMVIEGITESEANLTVNGRFVVVDSDGAFTYATTLEEGENNFNVKSEDKAGNTSEYTLKVSFFL